MAVSIVSSIIFFLLFIILSQYVDGNGFAAQMEHGKLGGVKKTMTMRRNLEENGQGSKIATPRSTSRRSEQKNIEKEPSKIRPDQATAHGKSLINYRALEKADAPVCHSKIYSNCSGKGKGPRP
ncbi:hypothetical protein ISN45_At01g024520 [Arabidopsis thaliana x Arabidopsis arenosa]|nr:hypothetical protein ISN45_At01g024520 [Arabidopsis thaliana x Arabidopsis arenosa]